MDNQNAIEIILGCGAKPYVKPVIRILVESIAIAPQGEAVIEVLLKIEKKANPTLQLGPRSFYMDPDTKVGIEVFDAKTKADLPFKTQKYLSISQAEP